MEGSELAAGPPQIIWRSAQLSDGMRDNTSGLPQHQPHRQKNSLRFVFDINNDFEPTEEESTEHGLDSVPKQPEQSSLRNAELTQENNCVGEDAFVLQLIEKLSSVSGDHEMKIHQYNTQMARRITIDDMISILKHINLCEATGVEPRWDLVYEMAYGQGLAHSADFEDESIRLDQSEDSIQIQDAQDETSDCFTLDPLFCSISSSITWHEHPTIDESECSGSNSFDNFVDGTNYSVETSEISC